MLPLRIPLSSRATVLLLTVGVFSFAAKASGVIGLSWAIVISTILLLWAPLLIPILGTLAFAVLLLIVGLTAIVLSVIDELWLDWRKWKHRKSA